MPIRRIISGFFYFSCFLLNHSYAEGKVLFLIIAHDSEKHLVAMQNVWRSYMNIDHKHVEAYFLKADPNIRKEIKVAGDTIFVKTEENFVPGCMNKTIMAMKYLAPRLSEFDYVIRTNLSSFFIFSRLFTFLETLPKTSCYCGSPLGWPCYASGDGIIFSPDLVQLMVDHIDELKNIHPIDDILISQFLMKYGITLIPTKQMYFSNIEQWKAGKNSISDNIFHFRTKNQNGMLRFPHDIMIQAELLKMFYDIEFDWTTQ